MFVLICDFRSHLNFDFDFDFAPVAEHVVACDNVSLMCISCGVLHLLACVPVTQDADRNQERTHIGPFRMRVV